jgi:hypothetical protein
LIKTIHQHLLLLVGFDTLIYRKYYDTPPILVGHHAPPEESIGDADLEFKLAEVSYTPSSSSLPRKPARASLELEAEPQSSPKKHAGNLKP